MVVLQPFQTPSRSKTGLSQIFSISIPPSSRKCKRSLKAIPCWRQPQARKVPWPAWPASCHCGDHPTRTADGEGSRWVHDLPILNFLDILSGGKTHWPSAHHGGPLISWKSHLAMSFLDIQCCLLGLTFCMNISQLASRNWVGSATNVLTGASRTTRNPGREVKMNNAAAKCPCLLWKLS